METDGVVSIRHCGITVFPLTRCALSYAAQYSSVSWLSDHGASSNQTYKLASDQAEVDSTWSQARSKSFHFAMPKWNIVASNKSAGYSSYRTGRIMSDKMTEWLWMELTIMVARNSMPLIKLRANKIGRKLNCSGLDKWASRRYIEVPLWLYLSTIGPSSRECIESLHEKKHGIINLFKPIWHKEKAGW